MIIYHQKVIFPQKSVPYSPEKIIQPHVFNIFTLKHDLRTFVEKMLRVAFTHLYGPNRSGCLGGWGGQPNLGNAWILGAYGPAFHPLKLQHIYKLRVFSYRFHLLTSI